MIGWVSVEESFYDV